MKIRSCFIAIGSFERRIWIIAGLLLIVSLIAAACSEPAPTPKPAVVSFPTPAPRQAFQSPAPAVNTQTEKSNAELLTKATLLDFARAQSNLERDWDAFRKSYMEWQQKTSQSYGVVYKGFNDFLARFVAVKKEVAQLQAPAGASEVVEKLSQAADREDAALKDLRDNLAVGDLDAFQKFDKERQEVNKLRRQAAAILQDLSASSASPTPRTTPLLETTTPPFTQRRLRTVDPQALQQFDRAFQAANKIWNDFEVSYDTWLSRDYSPEREASYSQLAIFVSNFRSLSSQISSLAAPGQLRPVAELMIQAAEKEEAALRGLRDNAKPYDARPYQAYEKEWATIDRLRRQASSSLTDLLFKQGISPSEIK